MSDKKTPKAPAKKSAEKPVATKPAAEKPHRTGKPSNPFLATNPQRMDSRRR